MNNGCSLIGYSRNVLKDQDELLCGVAPFNESHALLRREECLDAQDVAEMFITGDEHDAITISYEDLTGSINTDINWMDDSSVMTMIYPHSTEVVLCGLCILFSVAQGRCDLLKDLGEEE